MWLNNMSAAMHFWNTITWESNIVHSDITCSNCIRCRGSLPAMLRNLTCLICKLIAGMRQNMTKHFKVGMQPTLSWWYNHTHKPLAYYTANCVLYVFVLIMLEYCMPRDDMTGTINPGVLKLKYAGLAAMDAPTEVEQASSESAVDGCSKCPGWLKAIVNLHQTAGYGAGKST